MLCDVIDLKFSRIHLTQKLLEVLVVYGPYIIDVSVSEIEPRCCFFPVESKYFVWVQKYIGEKRDAICTIWHADRLLEDGRGKTHENLVN